MMLAMLCLIFILTDAVEASNADLFSRDSNGSVTTDTRNVGKLIAEISWKISEPYLRGCHFVLLTQDGQRSFVYHITRLSYSAKLPVIVIDLATLKGTYHDNRDLVWYGMRGTCKVLLADMTFEDNGAMLRFLQSSRLWARPHTKIIFVGRKDEIRDTLFAPVLRNTIHALYVALNDLTFRGLQNFSGQLCLRRNASNSCTILESPDKSVSPERVYFYSRCLYCNNGEPRAKPIGSWAIGSELPKRLEPFPFEAKSFYGYQIRTVSVPYFPIVNFQVDMKNPTKLSILEDCLSKRIIDTLIPIMNFTYSVAAPPDMQFGTPSPKGNGTWTGTVGVFQREQGDMTLMITNSDGKYPIMDLARLVPSDFIVIVSLKPTPPPQYFVIIRPFTVTVWMFVASSILIWAGFFWMLQKIRSQASGEKTVTLNWSLFHSFAVILEDPPPKIPNHSTGRILLGWWLLSCLILTTLFRSTLVSQLSVQSKTKPIDNFEDLISLSNYRWGIHDTLLGAQPKLYFTNEEDPVIVRVYRGSESITMDEALAKVMKGGYSLIASKNRLSYSVALNYMDDLGQIPFYISKRGYTVASDFGWAFRKGFPMFNRISQMLDRMTDAGLMFYWIKDVMETEFRNIRKRNKAERAKSGTEKYEIYTQAEDKIVLTTRHMIGVYLTMILGFILSILTLFVEIIVSKCHF